MTIIARDDSWDKVHACWLGKNHGGMLGAPVETPVAQDEPFAADWYPDLHVEGIPDDLGMQLIWLNSVEEQHVTLTSRTSVRYWLDHVGHAWDEDGLARANLHLGLRPPVSGHDDAWFANSMGALTHSDIWSCLACDVPFLAVRCAVGDACVDHTSGKGMWSEVVTAAVGSATFVERDPSLLLDIGLVAGAQAEPQRGIGDELPAGVVRG